MSSPVQAVEGILEEESQKTVCPGIGPEEVQHPQPGAAEADPGEELELEGCLAVELALDVVLEHELGQLGELAALGVDVPEQDEEVHCDPSPVRGVVYVTLNTALIRALEALFQKLKNINITIVQLLPLRDTFQGQF